MILSLMSVLETMLLPQLGPNSTLPTLGNNAFYALLYMSNLNISATSGPIGTKFYLKHHWVGGKDALGFGPDRIRTLVSMAADSSHRNIMGKML